jgi:hypothetical protein
MVEQDKTRHRVFGASQNATKETISVIGLPGERLSEAAVLLSIIRARVERGVTCADVLCEAAKLRMLIVYAFHLPQSTGE